MTDHAALIAKLQSPQYVTYVGGQIRIALPESIVAEAIAALQATPADIEGYRLSAAVSLCAFEKAEAQLAAQRTALAQLERDWRAQATEEAIDRDPGWVGAESTLRACADELAEILQDPPTSEDSQ